MKGTVAVFLILMSVYAHAQDDYISWSSVQLQTAISANTKLSLKPIIRYNDNLSRYQNFSIDIFVNQDFGNGWIGQLLSRTWFLPESKYRQFVWLDIVKNYNIQRVTVSNRLRYHYAFEISGIPDPVYLRWRTRILFRNDCKFKPLFQIEPWLRVDGVYQFQRMRYEPGFIWQIHDGYVLDFQYRIEKFFNTEPSPLFNVFVINLRIDI